MQLPTKEAERNYTNIWDLTGFDRELPLQLFIGGLIGYALARGNFGFASFVRRPYTTGNGTVVKAFVKMMLLTMVVYLGIQWFAQSNGALPEYAANGGCYPRDATYL